jgi:hypothetical protein
MAAATLFMRTLRFGFAQIRTAELAYIDPRASRQILSLEQVDWRTCAVDPLVV